MPGTFAALQCRSGGRAVRLTTGLVAGLGSTVTDSAWVLSGRPLSRYKSKEVNGLRVPRATLDRLRDKLMGTSRPNEPVPVGALSRLKDPLGHQLGLATLLAVMDALGARRSTACGTGLRFGLAYAFLHGIPLAMPCAGDCRPDRPGAIRRSGHLRMIDQPAQVVRERFEDQVQGEPALDVVIGLEAAVGQDEDVLGLEAAGQELGGAAVGGIGAGGSQAGGLPEDAAEEPRQLADQQAGAPALVDRFLARLLDVVEHAMGQGGRVEAMVGGQLVDQAAAEPLELGVGQPDGPADAPLAQRGQLGGLVGVLAPRPVRRSNAAISASGSGSNRTTWHRETIVSSWTSAEVPIRISTAPGGGSSRVFKNALAASSFRSSASSRIATLRMPRAGLSPNWSHRSRITRIGSSCLSSGRATSRKSGCVPASTWRQPGHASHGSSSVGGPGLAEQGLGQLPREGPLADPLGADEQQRVRESPLLETPAQLRHDPVMAADRVPGHGPPRS